MWDDNGTSGDEYRNVTFSLLGVIKEIKGRLL